MDALESLLKESKYDEFKMKALVNGFSQGFSLGYHVKQTAPNLKLHNKSDKILLWNKVMKEVQLKRYAGPFKEPPFKHFIQSPIGLKPKDNSRDVRLIFHLSYPRNSGKSINENMPRDLHKVSYPDFSDAIELDLCRKAGKFCKMSKSDMKSAFCILCMRPLD